MDQASGTNQTETPPYHIVCGKRDWTAEGIAAVIKGFVEDGKSMLLLAREFGTSIGSITGLLARARAKKLLAPAINRQPKERVVKVKPKKGTDPFTLKFKKAATAAGTPVKRVRLKIVDPTTVTFEELASHHCRYPFGDPKNSDFRYCGKARRDKDTYYCAEHCEIAYAGRFKNR